MKNFTHEEEGWKEHKHFLAEMERRFKDLETGREKGINMDQLKGRVRQTYANKTNRSGKPKLMDSHTQ